MLLEHYAEIMHFIYDKIFYNLFFHWSWQVRNVFYYILLYIVNYRIKKLVNVDTKHRGRIDSISEEVNYINLV
jgi:hypothetical protein